MPKGGESISR